MRAAFQTAVLFFALALVPVFSSCRHLDPAGVYKGDQVLHQAEVTTLTAKKVLQSYVEWEFQNRALLAKWPEITKSADYIRAHVKDWFRTAYATHDAYKTDPSEANKTALQTAMAILQTALAEANRYLLQAATN